MKTLSCYGRKLRVSAKAKVQWFRPSQLAEAGEIKAPGGRGEASVATRHRFILREIKEGRLKAKNYAKSGRLPYYLVPDYEVKRYLEAQNALS